MGGGTGLNRFDARFHDRTFDVGIAEQHAVTFAAGLACEGLRPFCTIYSTFLQRGYDQIIHDVCLQNLPGEPIFKLKVLTPWTLTVPPVISPTHWLKHTDSAVQMVVRCTCRCSIQYKN